MPTAAVHSRQAAHNKAFLAEFKLTETIYLDWAVTVMFYVALHLVEAYLASKDLHPMAHRIRDDYLSRTADLRPIYRSYRELEHHSQKARYQGTRFNVETVEALSDDLRKIERHMQSVLCTPLRRQKQ